MTSAKPEPSVVKPVIEPINPSRYRQAIVHGRAALEAENSKAAAARVIFQELIDEPREVVLRAFIEGANVTPKGSPTYFYNISRKFKRLKNQAAKTD